MRHILQGTSCPWDASSKGRHVHETHPPRDAMSMRHILQGTPWPWVDETHPLRDVMSKGRVVQGPHRPSAALSMKRKIRDFLFGDSSVGDTLSRHRSHVAHTPWSLGMVTSCWRNNSTMYLLHTHLIAKVPRFPHSRLAPSGYICPTAWGV